MAAHLVLIPSLAKCKRTTALIEFCASQVYDIAARQTPLHSATDELCWQPGYSMSEWFRCSWTRVNISVLRVMARVKCNWRRVQMQRPWEGPINFRLKQFGTIRSHFLVLLYSLLPIIKRERGKLLPAISPFFLPSDCNDTLIGNCRASDPLQLFCPVAKKKKKQQ